MFKNWRGVRIGSRRSKNDTVYKRRAQTLGCSTLYQSKTMASLRCYERFQKNLVFAAVSSFGRRQSGQGTRIVQTALVNSRTPHNHLQQQKRNFISSNALPDSLCSAVVTGSAVAVGIHGCGLLLLASYQFLTRGKVNWWMNNGDARLVELDAKIEAMSTQISMRESKLLELNSRLGGRNKSATSNEDDY
jgi:hypothetical protein